MNLNVATLNLKRGSSPFYSMASAKPIQLTMNTVANRQAEVVIVAEHVDVLPTTEFNWRSEGERLLVEYKEAWVKLAGL